MKSHFPFKTYLIYCLAGLALILTIGACNQTNSSSESTRFDEKPSTTIVPAPPVKDTTVIHPANPTTSNTTTSPNKPTTKDGFTTYPTPAPKTCQPNFKLIGKPKSNHYLCYVTGFNPSEFKCWNEMETFGEGICQGKPCVIYFVDDPSATMSAAPPNYVDPKILKEHGMGQFAHDENWWEMKGAKLWGRAGKEFAYYNTNNHLGG